MKDRSGRGVRRLRRRTVHTRCRPQRRCGAPLRPSTKPPHRARLRSNGVRAEKWRAGVNVMRDAAGRGLPPVERFDASNAGGAHERSVPQRRHDQRVEPLRKPFERPQIAMVVVVVAEQHRRDGRQVAERDRRESHPPWPGKIQRAGTLGVHRIRQKVSGRRLDQKRRVSDERNRGCCIVQSRGRLQRRLDVPRPRHARFEQHSRHG